MTIRLNRPVGYESSNVSENLGEECEFVRLEEVPEGTLYKWNVEAKPNGRVIRIFGRFLQPFIRRFYERTMINPIRKELE